MHINYTSYQKTTIIPKVNLRKLDNEIKQQIKNYIRE